MTQLGFFYARNRLCALKSLENASLTIKSRKIKKTKIWLFCDFMDREAFSRFFNARKRFLAQKTTHWEKLFCKKLLKNSQKYGFFSHPVIIPHFSNFLDLYTTRHWKITLESCSWHGKNPLDMTFPTRGPRGFIDFVNHETHVGILLLTYFCCWKHV